MRQKQRNRSVGGKRYGRLSGRTSSLISASYGNDKTLVCFHVRVARQMSTNYVFTPHSKVDLLAPVCRNKALSDKKHCERILV